LLQQRAPAPKRALLQARVSNRVRQRAPALKRVLLRHLRRSHHQRSPL
jgi:hypothetical protein